MALSVEFSTDQIPGSPADIIFNDETTGTDVTITQRRIYIQLPDGSFLVPAGIATGYNAWPNYPADMTMTIEDVLPEDSACRVTVQWLTAGNSVVYDKTEFIGFNCFNEDFDYQLTQNVASNQQLMNDNNFWANKNRLQTFIDSGDEAILRASDINAAQQCYDLATEMRLSAQYLFNQNS